MTGLSGAGKTTLRRELCSRLRAAGRTVAFLDGDTLRSVIAEDLGHGAGDRRQSAMRNARLCRMLAEQGRIYWLIEDCKRFGTLPFAGLARAGFIAVQLLQSFVEIGVLNAEEAATFMASVETVGSRIREDFSQLSKADFLGRYGHLRPGIYDIRDCNENCVSG